MPDKIKSDTLESFHKININIILSSPQSRSEPFYWGDIDMRFDVSDIWTLAAVQLSPSALFASLTFVNNTKHNPPPKRLVRMTS